MTPGISCRSLKKSKLADKMAPCKAMKYLKRLYFILSAIAYFILPYASIYAGLSCIIFCTKIAKIIQSAALFSSTNIFAFTKLEISYDKFLFHVNQCQTLHIFNVYVTSNGVITKFNEVTNCFVPNFIYMRKKLMLRVRACKLL